MYNFSFIMPNLDISYAFKIFMAKMINRDDSKLIVCQLIALNIPVSKVAEITGIPKKTIYNWINKIKSEGLNNLIKNQPKKRDSKTKKIKPQLFLDLHKKPSHFSINYKTWNGFILQTHVYNRYKMILSIRTCQKILREFKSTTKHKDKNI